MIDEPIGEVQPAQSARAALLRMANTWLTVGQINRAVDVYSRILARYPGSREAREAADKILALAQTHEHEGRYHLAMGLYDKLERLA